MLEEPFTFMVCHMLYKIKTRNKMQVNIFIFLFFCCLFGVYAMRFISTVIVREILSTCVIHVRTVQYQSEQDSPNFCVTWILMWFGKGYTQFFQVLGQIVIHCLLIWGRSYIHIFWTSMFNLYLYMDYFGIK